MIVDVKFTESKQSFDSNFENMNIVTLTPEIGENGNWYINDEDTGKPSRGRDGYTPVKNIDYFDGEKGADGKSALIVDSASGENIVLTDSAESELKGLRVFGKTEQFTTTSKNLFNPENVKSGYFTSTGTTITDDARCTYVYCECEPSTTYTVSKQAGARFTVSYTTVKPHSGLTHKPLALNNAESKLTVTTGNDAVYLIAYVHHSGYDTISLEDMLASVQIEKGSVATEYEPYREPTTSLVSVGDDGNIIVSVDGQTLTIPTPNGLPGIKVTDVSLATYTDAEGNMWCADEIDFERGVYVQRVDVESPIETPLSAEEIEAYKALHTNYPNTTISNDSDAWMDVKYEADTKNYIDKKITEILRGM